jgi:hypothetical protein
LEDPRFGAAFAFRRTFASALTFAFAFDVALALLCFT